MSGPPFGYLKRITGKICIWARLMKIVKCVCSERRSVTFIPIHIYMW